MATIPTPVVDEQVKLRFADALVRTRNAATAALRLFPENAGFALKLAMQLPDDPFVKAEMDRIKGDVGEVSLMPTKCDIARKVLERAELHSVDHEDFEKLMKLYCTIMGFVEKPGTNVGVAVTVSPVMVIRDHGTDQEWADKALEQQRRLVSDADHQPKAIDGIH